jgi:hypothetical protein
MLGTAEEDPNVIPSADRLAVGLVSWGGSAGGGNMLASSSGWAAGGGRSLGDGLESGRWSALPVGSLRWGAGS